MLRTRLKNGCLKWSNVAGVTSCHGMSANVLNFRGSLKGHNGWVTSIAAFNEDSNMIITGSRDKSLIVWKLTDDETIGYAEKRLTGHNGAVSDVCLAHDGKYVLSSSWDKTIRLWSLTKNACVRQFKGHESDVLSVTFSPDQRSIVSAGRDKTVRIWNIVGENRKTIQAHDNWVSCVRYSPSKVPMICTAGWDNTVKLWTAAQADEIELKTTLNAHTGPVNFLTVSPDGTLCASGGKDGKAILWDVNHSGVYDLEVNSTIHALAFSPKNYWICIATDDSIQVWCLEDQRKKIAVFNKASIEENVPAKDNGTPWVVSCAWSADGNRLFAGTSNNEVLVFDVME